MPINCRKNSSTVSDPHKHGDGWCALENPTGVPIGRDFSGSWRNACGFHSCSIHINRQNPGLPVRPVVEFLADRPLDFRSRSVPQSRLENLMVRSQTEAGVGESEPTDIDSTSNEDSGTSRVRSVCAGSR